MYVFFLFLSATDYDLRTNLPLGISVSRHTERVPKNVPSGPNNPQIMSKPRNSLWFATKSSPGHQRVGADRSSPPKRTQRVETLPGTFKPSYKLWFATKSSPGHQRVEAHRNSLQKLSGSKNLPRYIQNRATIYDLRLNLFLGIKVSRHSEIVPKNILSGAKTPQVHSKRDYKLWFATKSSPGH